MNSKSIIDTYYQGWAKRDKSQVRSVMADNMIHAAPEGKFNNADTFLAQCWGFGNELHAVRYHT